MYSESDIDGAVSAAALAPEAAQSLRAYVAASRAAPAADEESFRLLTGFNDIFVAIAIALMLTALAWIGASLHSVMLSGVLVAATSWALAEYFTRRRRMALPSIELLLTFIGAVCAIVFGALPDLWPGWHDERVTAIVGVCAGLASAGAAWLHWRRFIVPITVAAGALALVGVVAALVRVAVPGIDRAIFPILLAGGIGVFALAMWWDMSDRERRTRRADVAFWLHLAAAPLIAHPLFHLLGVFNGDIGLGQAVMVIALYVLFGLVALAIDRRALLVSSLVYVLYALWSLFHQAGVIELSYALTALVIGSALLTLSAFWQPMRRAIVGLTGSLGDRLPPVQLAHA